MIQKNLVQALVTLGAFFVALALIGVVFEDELTRGTAWVVEHVGFLGMCLILLVTDTLVTPFPPDILLIVIAHTELADHWFRYVLILGMISVVAGMLGWTIGRWLAHFPFAQRLFGEFRDDHREFIRRYGFWAVVVGATTPLPFSATCWGRRHPRPALDDGARRCRAVSHPALPAVLLADRGDRGLVFVSSPKPALPAAPGAGTSKVVAPQLLISGGPRPTLQAPGRARRLGFEFT